MSSSATEYCNISELSHALLRHEWTFATQMGRLSEDNSSLLERVSEAETSKALIEGQVRDFCLKLKQTTASSKVLQQEHATLKKRLHVSFQVHSGCLIDSMSACTTCWTVACFVVMICISVMLYCALAVVMALSSVHPQFCQICFCNFCLA